MLFLVHRPLSMYKSEIHSERGGAGGEAPLTGSGERCLGDSVKGPQLTSLLSLAAAGGMHRAPEELPAIEGAEKGEKTC